jgi:hypothetical protein
MNEKIKQLAAGAVFDVIALGRHDGVLFTETELEKFAEKIIRECAKIADNGYGSDNFGNGIAGYQLLNHFGIKK